MVFMVSLEAGLSEAGRSASVSPMSESSISIGCRCCFFLAYRTFGGGRSLFFRLCSGFIAAGVNGGDLLLAVAGDSEHPVQRLL